MVRNEQERDEAELAPFMCAALPRPFPSWPHAVSTTSVRRPFA
jgi:hypothetical protein